MLPAEPMGKIPNQIVGGSDSFIQLRNGSHRNPRTQKLSSRSVFIRRAASPQPCPTKRERRKSLNPKSSRSAATASAVCPEEKGGVMDGQVGLDARTRLGFLGGGGIA